MCNVFQLWEREGEREREGGREGERERGREREQGRVREGREREGGRERSRKIHIHSYKTAHCVFQHTPVHVHCVYVSAMANSYGPQIQHHRGILRREENTKVIEHLCRFLIWICTINIHTVWLKITIFWFADLFCERKFEKSLYIILQWSRDWLLTNLCTYIIINTNNPLRQVMWSQGAGHVIVRGGSCDCHVSQYWGAWSVCWHCCWMEWHVVSLARCVMAM